MGSALEPIKTKRLLLRRVRAGDLKALVSRRNDPEVAAMQDWSVPFTVEAATRMVEALGALDGPSEDEWWMLSIANADDDAVYGDLTLRLEWGGRAATVGYTLARDHWGSGYATEALNGLLDRLFESRELTRVGATLHPDNTRSARVLERCGFCFEGHTRNSFWSGDENSDDWLYGITPELRRDWSNRPTHRPEKVTLIEPHPVGLRDVIALEPHQSQKHFVAPIATSLAQVAVPPFEESENGDVSTQWKVKPWPRIIMADDEAVGFVMMECPTPTCPEPYLWRLIVDRRHQGRGIGWRALELVASQAREWGCDSLLVSWGEGYGSPGPMYKRFGFESTGKVDGDETVGRLRFS